MGLEPIDNGDVVLGSTAQSTPLRMQALDAAEPPITPVNEWPRDEYGHHTSYVLCSHANENPALCECSEDCVCKSINGMCATRARNRASHCPRWWRSAAFYVSGTPADHSVIADGRFCTVREIGRDTPVAYADRFTGDRNVTTGVPSIARISIVSPHGDVWTPFA
jgi:hypothetical protein